MDVNDHTHESCRELFLKLSEYLDGELSAAQHQEIERHAAACRKCHTCIKTLRRTVDLCHNLKPQPVPDAFAKTLAQLATRMKA